MASNRRAAAEGGNTLVEFALVIGFLLPMLVLTVSVGMALSRSIQVTQIARDAGHMYARWVDFSLPGNQQLLVHLAGGMGMTATGGNGKIILSKIMFIGEQQCLGAGLTLPACTNYNHPVILQRIVVGNPSLRLSDFGEPAPSLLDTSGNVSDYLTHPSARATGFQDLLALAPGELAFVAEAYFEFPELQLPGVTDANRIYARAIF